MYILLKDRNVRKKAKQIIHHRPTISGHILVFGSECWTKRLEQQITTTDMKVIRMIHQMKKGEMKAYTDSVDPMLNMLPIVQTGLIDKNKLRWFGHVTRRERGRVNADGYDEVKNGGKYTTRNTNTRVARQHR